MSTITYSDGTKINFNGDPTQQDVQEAYNQVKGGNTQSPTIPQQPAETLPYTPQNQPIQPSLAAKVGNFIAPAASSISQAIIPHTQASQDLATSQKNSQDLDLHIIQEIHAAKAAGNTKKVQALTKALALTPGAQPSQEDIATNNQGFQTPGQIIGNFAQTGLNALSGGTLAGAGTLPTALSAAQPALEAVSKGVTAGQDLLGASKIAGKVVSGAGLGALSGAAGAASNNKNIVQGAEQGAALGGAIPALIGILGGIKNATGSAIAGTLGLTTGAGKKAVQEAATNPTQTLIDAMRGKTSNDDVISLVKNALNNVKDQQRSTYLDAFDKAAGSGATIDEDAVKGALTNALKNFRATVGEDGTLDLSRSTISQSSAGDLQKAVNEVTTNKDWSVSGTDALKQRVDDLINYNSNQSSKTQAAIKQIASGVRDQLNQVPGYTEATKPYAATQDFLTQINKSLSTSNKAAQETTAKKILSTLKDSTSPVRQALLSQLEEKTGANITGAVAGSALSKPINTGISGVAEGAGLGYGILSHAIAGPSALAGVAAASPRLVGEGAVKYGQASNLAGQVVSPAIRALLTRQAILQGGKTAGGAQ